MDVYDGFLDVTRDGDLPSVRAALEGIASSGPAALEESLAVGKNLMVQKFHPYLSPALLVEDAVSSRVDFENLPRLAERPNGPA